MNARLLALAGILAIGATAPALAQDSMSSMGSMKPPIVGGAPMYPNKNIVQNASQAKNLTTLVTLVKDAGLVSTLEGKGPFTVFAPTNDAFAKLPAATVAAVQKPENKALLTKILTYHVVAGDYTAAKIADAIKAGNGTATLTTVQGEPLMASMDGDKLVLTDAKGGKSTVIVADVKQSNGVVHAVDTVLMPK